MIEDDKLDVACGDYQCTEGRLEGFFCTLPFDYRKYQIFEEVRRSGSASIWKRMQHFLLSTPEWTAVFCLLMFIITLLSMMRCGRPKGARTWTLFILTTSAGLATLLGGSTYSALFTDRAVYKEPTKPKTLNTLVNDLRRGYGTMILESKDEFKEEEVRDFFGTETPSDNVFKGVADVQLIVDMLCSDPNTAFFDFNFKLAFQFSRTLLNIWCELEPISNVDYALIPPESSIHFLEVGSESPKVHMYSRRMSYINEKVNYLVLGLYSYEKFSSFWFRRHTGRNQYAESSAQSVFTRPQITYARVAILVEVFSVAYGVIAGVFIGEVNISLFCCSQCLIYTIVQTIEYNNVNNNYKHIWALLCFLAQGILHEFLQYAEINYSPSPSPPSIISLPSHRIARAFVVEWVSRRTTIEFASIGKSVLI
uniref:Uncharacterized protein n=1 Tax=Pristionchus pacificus TaxID=54126 RepID=A0A8R1V5B3_PRIPA